MARRDLEKGREPGHIAARVGGEVGAEAGEGDPLPLRNLGGVRSWLCGPAADEDMIDLVLDQPVLELRSICERAGVIHIRADAHLLEEASRRGRLGRLARTRMGTTTAGSTTSPMIV